MKDSKIQGRSRVIVEPYRTEHSAYRYTVIDMVQDRVVIVTSDKHLAAKIAQKLDEYQGDSTINILKSD